MSLWWRPADSEASDLWFHQRLYRSMQSEATLASPRKQSTNAETMDNGQQTDFRMPKALDGGQHRLSQKLIPPDGGQQTISQTLKTPDGGEQTNCPTPMTANGGEQTRSSTPMDMNGALQKEMQIASTDGGQQSRSQTPMTIDSAHMKEIAIDVGTDTLDLPSPPKTKPSAMKRCAQYFCTEVTNAHADILLLTCCFISGLVDSTVYNAYGTFVSMQTGNTIFLGLGGSTPNDTSKPYGWAKSLASIISFTLGCLFFSRLSRLLRPLRRSTLTTSFLLQTLLICLTAAVIQARSIEGDLDNINDDIDWRQMVPIALLSFQSAGQIVGSRALGLAEVPTVVLTSMLHDIATDPALLGSLRGNVKRNRRVLAFVGILVGAVAGGFIAETTTEMQVPLWIAGGLKMCVTCAWLVWPEKRVSKV